jgi:hypothetical protein
MKKRTRLPEKSLVPEGSPPRQQEDQSSGQFESDRLAHDLRVQLTTIRAGLGLLNMKLEGQLEPAEEDLLLSVRASVEHLCEMIESAVAPELHNVIGDN